MGQKPVILLMEMHNPTVPSEFEPAADAVVLQFGVTKAALFDVIFGRSPAKGKLPCHMPKDMEDIEKHCEDRFNDYEAYQDSEGNRWEYGFGLSLTPKD